jgi:hypothetical protein
VYLNFGSSEHDLSDFVALLLVPVACLLAADSIGARVDFLGFWTILSRHPEPVFQKQCLLCRLQTECLNARHLLTGVIATGIVEPDEIFLL